MSAGAPLLRNTFDATQGERMSAWIPDPMVVVARVDWPASDGGGSADVSFTEGVFYLDGAVPLEDASELATLDQQVAVTWARTEGRQWYYAHLAGRPDPVWQSPAQRQFPSGIAVALSLSYIVGLYASAGALTMGSSMAGAPLPDLLAELAFNAWILLALVGAFLADVLISRSAQMFDTGRAIRVGRYRFFHGPLLLAIYLGAFVVGLIVRV